MQSASLFGADLQGADLNKANLMDADLEAAKLEGAIFYRGRSLPGTVGWNKNF